ncbi:MAG: LON peptidase substrate-binding domain-containing protein [Acidimicrobiia bacterium]|nr:LON peptidase substrate-binding domain-containing protein [Acidimicrobiia bacterium]MDH4306024.1 LON peptidase substrate-binding domain-containing protein [Acidimicrobiia bacterium]MDH5292156.1 LON peptidase substrate-binding domain-containing protein [Acidimicrobiia bacterium]
MFPLGSVVMPYTAVPLRVFEPRYQLMLDDVVSTDSRFGTTLIERGFEVGGGDSRFGVGTLVEVVEVAELDGGHRAVVVAGIGRVEVREWLSDDPYPRASVVELPIVGEPEADALGKLRLLLERFAALSSELGIDGLGTANLDVSADSRVAAYQLTALCPFSQLDRMKLLSEPRAEDMVESAIELLASHVEIVRSRLEHP